jgi:hypothetical protein
LEIWQAHWDKGLIVPAGASNTAPHHKQHHCTLRHTLSINEDNTITMLTVKVVLFDLWHAL